jgi:NitT/TauT family transport system substrate-binding protein
MFLSASQKERNRKIMKLKRILSAVAAFALCASLAGCGASASSVAESTEAVSTVEEEASPETSAETTALRVAGLKGPTTMGLVNMLTADDAADLVDFNMYGAADEVVPLLVKGDIDAAAVPANLAATLRLPASTRWACCTSSKMARP